MRGEGTGAGYCLVDWIPCGATFQNIRHPITVLDAGTVNDKADQQAKRVGGNVALAPLL